jgi:predicted nucleotidyltransferase
MNIDDIKRVSASVCKMFDVKQLDVFGSVARGTADDTSDVDLIVEFCHPELHPSKRFFGLLHQFEDKLHCKVDLLTLKSIRNPYFRKRVLSERTTIYER